MEAEIITKESFAAAFDDCIERVKAEKSGLDKKKVVIVPDKYTLYAERRLFCGGGSFDTEVVTFSRLLSKTGFRPKNALSKFGAVMLLRKLIGDGEDLKCFHRSARFTGFAATVYDTIAQLNASLVTPEMLAPEKESDEALRVKMSDLQLLHRRYLDATEDKYTDPSAQLSLLPEAILKSGYLDGANVYIVNFDRFTAQHLKVIEAITERAESVSVYRVEERISARTDDDAEIEIYSAPDAASQFKAVARAIRNEIIEEKDSDCPPRFGDFCVVAASPDYRTVSRIFSEYGITFSLDEKYPLSMHPKARYLFAALDAADGRLSRAKAVKLAKTALTGIKTEDAQAFENYCNARRIEYKGLTEKFDDPIAESVRARVLDEIVLPLKESLKASMSAEEFVGALKNTLALAVGVPYPTSPYDLESFGGKFDETLELLGEIMSGGEYPLPLLAATLKEGVESRSLAYLPAVGDCVAVGAPSLFRGQRFRKIFAVGFDDGVLPPFTRDCGVITDGEIDRLALIGAAVEPKTQDVNRRAESELRHLLCSCKRLFLSYTASDEGAGGANMLAEIRRLARGKISVSDGALEAATLDYADEGGDGAALLLKAAGSLSSARELFLRGMKRPSAPWYQSTLAAALGKRADELLRDGGDDFVLKKPYDIFFRKKTVYISQIQTFFCCPYRHFLQYGLELKERPDGSVDPRDVGTILHRAAECYVRGGKFDSPERDGAELFKRLIKEEFSEFANMPSGRLARLESESARLCVTIAEQFRRSDYRAFLQEKRFSPSDGELRSPCIKIKGKEASVVGMIDRVDLCGEKRVRIIDYKSGYVGSGREAVGPERLYYGVKFQLQFYGEVLRRNGYDVSGLFYFPIKGDWSGGDDYLRMVGIFDSDLERVDEMDNSLSGGGKSELFNVTVGMTKKGVRSVNKRNTLALDSAKLSNACDYSFKVFDSGAEDIVDGLIRPMPYKDGESSACDYCPYASVCVPLTPEFRPLSGDVKNTVYGEEKS